jgi:hypothetical protein
MKRWLMAFIVPWLCVACADEPSASFDHRRFEPVPLQGEVLNADPVLARPWAIRWAKGRLWVADGAHDPALHLIDAVSGRLILSIGRKGEGPGEFASVPTIHIAPGDTSGGIWAYDSSLGRLTWLKPLIPLLDPVTVRVEPALGGNVPGGVPVPWRVAWVEPERLIGVNPSDSARFSIISPSGALIRTVPGALLGPMDAPFNERMKATMTGFFLCPWPERGFALLFTHVGRIEYYDRDARAVRVADVPFPSDGFVTDRDGNLKPFYGDNYYKSCVVHDDRLYAAFSGRRDRDYEPGDPASSAAGYLHVFNWSGELTEVFRLNPPVTAIDIPPEGGVLYATSLSTAAIYRFPLSGVAGATATGPSR